jgi:hypothetical protein
MGALSLIEAGKRRIRPQAEAKSLPSTRKPSQAETPVYILTESERDSKERLLSVAGIIPHEIADMQIVDPATLEPIPSVSTSGNQQLEIWAFPGTNEEGLSVAIAYKSDEQLARDGVQIIPDPLPERVRKRSRSIKETLISLVSEPTASSAIRRSVG